MRPALRLALCLALLAAFLAPPGIASGGSAAASAARANDAGAAVVLLSPLSGLDVGPDALSETGGHGLAPVQYGPCNRFTNLHQRCHASGRLIQCRCNTGGCTWFWVPNSPRCRAPAVHTRPPTHRSRPPARPAPRPPCMVYPPRAPVMTFGACQQQCRQLYRNCMLHSRGATDPIGIRRRCAQRSQFCNQSCSTSRRPRF